VFQTVHSNYYVNLTLDEYVRKQHNKHYVKINTKKYNILTQFVEIYFFSKINIYNMLKKHEHSFFIHLF